MNTVCRETRSLLADHLDGLLDPEAAAAVEAHLRTCRACAAEGDRMRSRLERLYRPYPVPPPAADMRERILRSALRPRRRRAGLLATAWRCAASFAAGVLITVVVMPERPTDPAPGPTPTAVEVPASSPSADLPPPLRRIR